MTEHKLEMPKLGLLDFAMHLVMYVMWLLGFLFTGIIGGVTVGLGAHILITANSGSRDVLLGGAVIFAGMAFTAFAAAVAHIIRQHGDPNDV